MNSKVKLLVVDDEFDFLELVRTAFEDIYAVTAINNSKDCLRALESDSFDLVLLDINIDDANGFDICDQIKKGHANTDVIFISGLSRQEDIVRGYQVGAIDYVVKPIRLKELKEKIALILSLRDRIKRSEDNSRDAQQVAFSAMTDSSQLGKILEFMDNNVNCGSINEVASSLLETCEVLNLFATVYISTPHEKVVVSSGGPTQPIETLLIEQVRAQNRIIDFNHRTLYTDKHVTVLIKNMPIDDPIEYGRFKDSLMTLACGANSRVRAILNEQLLVAGRDSVANALFGIEKRIVQQADMGNRLMSEFMVNMESTILVLGLSEDQEDYILSLVDSHLKSVVEMVASAAETQSMLKASLNNMQ